MIQIYAFGVLMVLMMGCQKLDNPALPHKEKENFPLLEYTGPTVLDLHDGSRLNWEMHTQRLVKWPGEDLVDAHPVDLIVYDSLGNRALKVDADSGSMDEAVTFLSAKGDVKLKSAKGVKVMTDSLRWNKKADQISTEAFVKVVSADGDTVTGTGFVSDGELQNWQILNNVRAVFQKVEQRLGDMDNSDSATASEEVEEKP